MAKEYVTWEQVEEFVEHVAKHVEENQLKISGVYGIPRGGLVFAVMLSHRLHVPMLASATNDCLVVDDICDSGESLIHYVKNTSNPTEPKPLIATMYYKENKLGIVPDIYKFKKTDQWIVFPFEYDLERKENN